MAFQGNVKKEKTSCSLTLPPFRQGRENFTHLTKALAINFGANWG